MESIYVQFSGSDQTKIIASFSSQQSDVDYPNQGVVEADDARWAEFCSGLPQPYGQADISG